MTHFAWHWRYYKLTFTRNINFVYEAWNSFSEYARIFDYIRIESLSIIIVFWTSSFRESKQSTSMPRIRKTISELISRAITSIEDFQSVTSFSSKIDSILKTRDSLSIKAKKRSFDVKNKRSRSDFDDQSTRRLKSRFKHFEKNLKTRRNDRDRDRDRDDRENRDDRNDRNDRKKEMTETEIKECQIKCFILFQLNSEINLNSIQFNCSFRSFETNEASKIQCLFALKIYCFFIVCRISIIRSDNI